MKNAKMAIKITVTVILFAIIALLNVKMWQDLSAKAESFPIGQTVTAEFTGKTYLSTSGEAGVFQVDNQEVLLESAEVGIFKQLEDEVTLYRNDSGTGKTDGPYGYGENDVRYSLSKFFAPPSTAAPALSWAYLGVWAGVGFLAAFILLAMFYDLITDSWYYKYPFFWEAFKHWAGAGEMGETLIPFLATLLPSAISYALLIFSENGEVFSWENILLAVVTVLLGFGTPAFLLLVFVVSPLAVATISKVKAGRIKNFKVKDVPEEEQEYSFNEHRSRAHRKVKRWLDRQGWDREIGEGLWEGFEGTLGDMVKVTRELK